MDKNPYSDQSLPDVKPMPKPPDSRIIPLDRQTPLTHQQVEQVRFGLGDTGPLAQAVMNANVPALNKQLTIGAIQCLSTKRPSDPVIGQMIYETDTQRVFFWSGSSWSAPINMSPTGTITPFAGINAPTGWLLCGGQSVSRSTYSDLFSAFSITFASAGTTNGSPTVTGLSGMSASEHVGWGIAGSGIPSGATITAVGSATSVTISANATATATVSLVISPYGFTGADNTTTFLIPDLRGRVPAGKDNMNTASSPARITTAGSGILGTSLGASGGKETHTLTSGESGLPAHSHPFQGSTSTWGAVVIGLAAGAGATTLMSGNFTSTANNSAANASSAHLNTQPTVIANYIIKT